MKRNLAFNRKAKRGWVLPLSLGETEGKSKRTSEIDGTQEVPGREKETDVLEPRLRGRTVVPRVWHRPPQNPKKKGGSSKKRGNAVCRFPKEKGREEKGQERQAYRSPFKSERRGTSKPGA